VTESTQEAGPPARASRLRDVLVVVLALTTGAVNAVTFLRLGSVFSSVITGNLALLGIAAGQRDGGLAVNGALALAGYIAGVVAGGAVSGAGADRAGAGKPAGDIPVWPRRTTVTLAVELLVLAAFCVGWLGTEGQPAGVDRAVLLVVASVAMGLQSSAVRRLGTMSSTYLTSTLTGILEAFSTGRLPPSWERSVGALLALAAGAAAGSAAASAAPLLLVTILAPLAAVVAIAVIAAAFSIDGAPGVDAPDGRDGRGDRR
jgi:uncharacterized membrane protein YoaK (UPF0700 family)